MRTIKKDIPVPSRHSVFSIIPIGDVHIGARASDEDKFKQVIDRIKNDENARWIGMGDYCDFITLRDPRSNLGTLADWLSVRDLGDLAKAQMERFLEFVKPIASKCLGMLEGNHETAIHRHYERDIYSEIVSNVKAMGGFKAEERLAVGYYGWILPRFIRGQQRSVVKINVHHGFVGGKLAGAKSLEMQRWLWSHGADVTVFGHSHNTGIQIEEVEDVDDAGRVVRRKRFGCYSGSFLKTLNEDGESTYSEVKGYYPMPNSGVEVWIRPGAFDRENRSEPIRVITADF